MKSGSFFSALGAILLATVSTTGKANDNHDNGHDTDVHAVNVSSQTLTDPYPYYFPVAGAQKEDETPFPMPLCYGTRIEEASIVQLQGYLTDGTLTSAKLLECYLRRIMQVDTFVEGIMELNPDAFEIAHALDLQRSQDSFILPSPVYGIPFLVKDNIATKDKMQTTAGFWGLIGSVVPRDAHVVKLLREAGALLLGHATLSEWADMRSNSYSEGYSPRGGQARSPYNLTMNGGGSSTGSAGAVAANEVTFALGTETDGSVISPSERNGLVGLKPTVGLTSRKGVIPESEHQDTVGVLARSVADAAAVLGVIAGVDERDNYTLAQVEEPGRTFTDYTQFLADSSALEGAVFGVPWDSFWVYAEADNLPGLFAAIEAIESAGGTVLNGTEIPNYKTFISPDGWDWDYGTTRGFPNESEFTVVKVDFYNNIKTYLAELSNTNIRSLEDIVAYNYANEGTEGGTPGVHPAFESGQDSFLASLETKGVRNETYWQAVEYCKTGAGVEGIDAALKYNKTDGTIGTLDGLLVPSNVGQSYQVAAQAGYPMITFPAGVNNNAMPYGLGIMNTAWSEPLLVRWGSAIEDLLRTKGTVRPTPKWWMYTTKNIPVLYDS